MITRTQNRSKICRLWSSVMKSLCSILMLMIAVHAQCGVQCLGADLNIPEHKVAPVGEQPPCHQQAENPPGVPSDQESRQHDHGNGNACGQAQTPESKIAPISKCVLHCTSLESIESPVSLDHFADRISMTVDADQTSTPRFPTSLPVLRI